MDINSAHLPFSNLLSRYQDELEFIGLETQADGKVALQLVYDFGEEGKVRYEILNPVISMHPGFTNPSHKKLMALRKKMFRVMEYLLNMTNLNTWCAYTQDERLIRIFLDGVPNVCLGNLDGNYKYYIGDKEGLKCHS